MDRDDISLILRAVLGLGRRLRAERPPGSASLAAIGILASLHRLGPVPAVRLAEEERLQPQSLTRILAQLERDGLIARSPSPEDRRELTIRLTPPGREMLAADIDARRRWLEGAAAAVLADHERAVLRAAADAMLKLAAHDRRAGDK